LFMMILMLMQHANVALGSNWRHDLEQGVETWNAWVSCKGEFVGTGCKFNY
jgi:hypothetical protein